MKLTKIAMSGLFSLAILPVCFLAVAPIASMALTFGDSGWTMLIGVGVMFLGTGIVVAMHMTRAKREFRNAAPEPPSEKISGSLVALSSAAILAVYAAGYFHTRTAANRFLEEAAVEQRAAAAATGTAPPAAEGSEGSAAADSRGAAASRSGSRSGTQSGSAPGGSADTSSSSASNARSDGQSRESADSGGNSASDASSANPGTAPTYGLGETPSAASLGAADGADDQSGSQSAAPAPGEPAPPAAPAMPAAKVHYKDGTYLGWGTCRHGDIQASVVIQDGKIASADISKCYTRYPCDIIGQLPGQVVTRQSVAVDYVSGATQSVYAFQEAVSAALAMARGK